MTFRKGLSFWHKLIALAVWCAAGALFWTLSPDVAALNDPYAAVSLLASSRPAAMAFQMLVLVCVAAAVATMVLGRWLPDAGAFAAAIGLASAALTGGTSEALLISYAEGFTLARAGLAAKLAMETLVWTAAAAAALILSAAVCRWFFGPRDTWDVAANETAAKSTAPPIELAALSIPWFGPRWRDTLAGSSPAPAREGLRHTAFVAGGMIVLLALLSLDSGERPVLHGQVCFVVTASAWIASYYGFRYFPVSTAMWALLAVPIVAVAGYLWSAVVPVGGAHPVNLPPSAFMRPLPIQYVGLGFAGVLAAFWFVNHPATAARHAAARRDAQQQGLAGRRSAATRPRTA